MKTTDWDRLAASSPLNADAARAWVYGDGDDAPTLLEHAVARLPHSGPEFVNWIGRRVGRLMVVAYAGSTGKGHGRARWIVRCLCGRYEFRKTPALRKARSPHCQACNRLIYMREGAR